MAAGEELRTASGRLMPFCRRDASGVKLWTDESLLHGKWTRASLLNQLWPAVRAKTPNLRDVKR